MTAVAWFEKPQELRRPFLAALVVHFLMLVLLIISFADVEKDDSTLGDAIPVAIITQVVRQQKEVEQGAPDPATEAQVREEGMMLEDRTLEESIEQGTVAREELEKELAEKKEMFFGANEADLLNELLFESLEEEIAEEARTLAELDERERIQVYIAAITRSIEQKWSRPLNARLGMVARLRIEMVPTGEIVSVALVESSGFPIFDRSAEVAARRASPLPVPEDSNLFERHFRSLNVVFNPTDLDF